MSTYERTPIEFHSIRPGDRVEREVYWKGEVNTTRFTIAKRFARYGVTTNGREWENLPGACWFLLDRPKPVVVLPTEPTLGWVTTGYEFSDNGPTLAFAGQWKARRDGMAGDHGHGYRRINGKYGKAAHVSAFIPATAVPTEALDALRARWHDVGLPVGVFFAAVDAANGGAK